MEKRQPYYTVGAATMKNNMEFLKKTTDGTAFWSSDLNQMLGLYHENPETLVQKSLCTPLFIAALFPVAKCWKESKCPSANEWIKKLWFIYTKEYYTAERKEFLPFMTALIEVEGIMLSEVSQALKDKYHMISPISGTYSTKQTNEQNITRDIEVKNKLTVTKGSWREVCALKFNLQFE